MHRQQKENLPEIKSHRRVFSPNTRFKAGSFSRADRRRRRSRGELTLMSLPLCCSHTDQLLGERGARREVRRGIAGEPETVAVAEIRHGLVPVPRGRKHDRLYLQPQQNPRAHPGEHVLPLRPLHPPVPHAPPQLCGW